MSLQALQRFLRSRWHISLIFVPYGIIIPFSEPQVKAAQGASARLAPGRRLAFGARRMAEALAIAAREMAGADETASQRDLQHRERGLAKQVAGTVEAQAEIML